MSDEDFEKEMEEIAAGGFPGADDDDMDDDFLSSFPGGDDDGPDFGEDADEEDPFAAFPDDDEEEAEEEVAEDNSFEPNEDEDLEWDEDEVEDDEVDLDPDDPEGFGEFDDEDPEEDPEYIEEYEDYEGEEEVDQPKGKGNLIFWGATSAIALAIAGAGYAVLMPMFFSGSDAPVRQAPSISQVSNFDPSSTPRQPPAIPNASGAPVKAPSLPGAANNRIQVPGHPANVDTNAIRPDLTGQQISLPGAPKLPVAGSFQPGVTNEPKGNIDLEPKVVNNGIKMPTIANNVATVADAPTNVDPVPTAAPDRTGMDEVMGKLDSVLSRFDTFEEKFVSKDDVEEMVETAVAKVAADIQVGDANIDTSGLARVEDLEDIKKSLADLAGRLGDVESAESDKVESVDASVIEAEVESRVKEAEAAIAERMLEMGKTLEAYETALNELKSKVGKEGSAKSDGKEATALKQKLEKQKRELVALKAKGAGYAPQRKPEVVKGYRLAGLSKDQAWIETPTGVQRFSVGHDIRGVGTIEEFRAMDGNFAVITSAGIIIP